MRYLKGCLRISKAKWKFYHEGKLYLYLFKEELLGSTEKNLGIKKRMSRKLPTL
ncbi:hypothetical protein CpB0915 [Chlamydia pneumoniae TW-183]|uniref:Uncharacterized protein n=1 Tax=Chlamydia pneumoniae TaxID=83558 RepID=A0ABN3YQG4_CHLPN|nr:hypothetical protein CpB0915 [Chlamydia pneumoniae TW-183]ACZ32772.1 hypothetical protein CPK_ORF00295 [Chlamydia pneumoniae LPCoLN]